jgi:hypothetical protein
LIFLVEVPDSDGMHGVNTIAIGDFEKKEAPPVRVIGRLSGPAKRGCRAC